LTKPVLTVKDPNAKPGFYVVNPQGELFLGPLSTRGEAEAEMNKLPPAEQSGLLFDLESVNADNAPIGAIISIGATYLPSGWRRVPRAN
jgi:hypothetical protein